MWDLLVLITCVSGCRFRPCVVCFRWVQACVRLGLGLGPRIRKQMVLKVSPGDLLTANGAFPLVHSPSLSVSLPLFPLLAELVLIVNTLSEQGPLLLYTICLMRPRGHGVLAVFGP